MKKSIPTIIILLFLSATRFVTAQSVDVDTNFVYGGCNNRSMTVIRNNSSESSFKLEINEITSTSSFGLSLITPTDYNTGIIVGRTLNFNLSTNQYGALAMEGETAADTGSCLVKTILRFAQNNEVIDTIYFFLRKASFQLHTPSISIEELKPEYVKIKTPTNQTVNCKYGLVIYHEVVKDSFYLTNRIELDTIHFYAITNLTPKTKYKLNVVAGYDGCSSKDGVVTFQTPCSPLSNIYENSFEEKNDCEQLINNNSNGWSITFGPTGYSGKVLQHLSASNSSDNWFISQGIYLQKGDKYYLRYNYSVNSSLFTERFKVTIGSSSLNTSNHFNLVNFQGINNTEIKTDSVVFEVDSSDIYYLGVNCFSEANQSTLYIDNIKLASLTHTGLQNQNIQEVNFDVFPNPNNGSFKIRYNSSASAIYHITLINGLGQEVWNESHQLNAGINDFQIGKSIRGGVYTLVIKNQTISINRKIIIRE